MTMVVMMRNQMFMDNVSVTYHCISSSSVLILRQTKRSRKRSVIFIVPVTNTTILSLSHTHRSRFIAILIYLREVDHFDMHLLVGNVSRGCAFVKKASFTGFISPHKLEKEHTQTHTHTQKDRQSC
jgi:predicted RNA-binding protein